MKGEHIEFPKICIDYPKDGQKVLQEIEEHSSITDGEADEEIAI